MRLRPWLTLSFGLNLLLAGAVVWAAKARPKSAAPSPRPRHNLIQVVGRRHAAGEAPSTVAEIPSAFCWHQIESADYRVYVQNLRAIGCPEATVRDILVADVNELFAGRVRDLVNTVQDRFWEFMLNEEDMEKLVDEKQKELRAFDDERKKILEALFGQKDLMSERSDEENRADRQASWAQKLDYLPADKVAQVLDLKGRFERARRELPQPSDERERKVKELNAEEEHQLEALLTPEELTEYKLRTSEAANMRLQLADLNVTEEELRLIARAKMGQQQARSALNRKGADYRARQAELQAQADEQIRQGLGPERFAAFQRASDDAYQQALKITDRFEMPNEVAVQVYQMRKEAEAQARTVRNDRNRAVEERQEILKAIRAETEKSISEALGVRAFKAYQKYGGDWLSEVAQADHRN